MACLSSIKGISFACDVNLAGIKEVWLGDYDAFVTTVDATKDNKIATFARVDSEGTDVLYHYAFAKQTGSLTSEMTKNEQNGTLYYTNTINLQFNRLEGDKHLEIEALSKGQLIAIVHDNNDQYWFVGKDSYVSADTTTAQTGQAFDDLSGYNTVLSAQSGRLPYVIEFATFEPLTDGYVAPEE